VYLNRSVFGLRALLYRLRAQVDVKALHRQEARVPLGPSLNECT
jgi:hypothetical protein